MDNKRIFIKDWYEIRWTKTNSLRLSFSSREDLDYELKRQKLLPGEKIVHISKYKIIK